MASCSGAGSEILLTILSANTLTLLTLDILILSFFLVTTLIVGLSYGREVKTIKDFALGNKKFSTATLVATILATFASGSGFFINIENTYTKGLYFIVPLLGIPLHLWINGQLAIRMGEFMQHVSIAEAMGNMYGKTVQVITAFSSILSRTGYIAIQFKVIARVIILLFNVQEEWATTIAAGITILYSAFGGIKSVTFTDVLQFFIFGTVLPVLALVIWNSFKDPSQVMATLASNPTFDLKQVVSKHPQCLSAIGLFLYFAMPHLQPELFQRIAMAKNVRQARRAISYSVGFLLLINLTVAWIAVLTLTDKPGLAKEEIVPYIVKQHAYPGMVGLLGAGIIALAMSTADSSLNSISVMFAHDFVRPLMRLKQTSVATARTFSVFIGFLGLFLALYNQDLLRLVLLSASCYMPIYSMPLLWAILGFRTSKRVVLLSMAAGTITVILWSISFTNANSVVPGIVANLIVLLGAHYLLGEPGGWQKVDPNSPQGIARAARKEAWQKRLQAIRTFKLYPYLQQLLPPKEGVYTFFGFYAMAATYIGLFTIGQADIKAYEGIYEGIYKTVLWAITAFITFPIWPSSVKSYRFMTFFWPLGMAAILLFTGMLLVILSHFHPLQVMVLMVNFLVAALLLRWPSALTLALSSISLAVLFFKQYTGEALPWGELGPLQLRVLYSLLVFTSLLLAFFAYQEAYRRLGKKNEALQSREKDQQANLLQVATEKQAALSALQHIGVEKLLTITRELQKLPIAEEGKEKMKALQTELIPIAFQLQGIDTRVQDYLRLQKANLPLKSWCDHIKEVTSQKGVTARIYCRHDTKCQQISCDPEHLTSLLVNSIMALSAQIEALEDKPAILFRLEDTQLGYALPDVAKSYVKYVPAVRIAITTDENLPPLAPSYSPNLNGPSPMAPVTAQDLAKLANSRIIKSHYGYAEVTDDTLIYVVPVDIEEVRPKDMGKDYMEVGVTPKRADDHFKNKEKEIDAQVQEATFLTEVAACSSADIGMVKMALELIKWYHGPKNRKSGEPFYLHPLAVAQIALDYNQDASTIIGALLHDTVEDTPMLLQHIEAVFGKETAEVVDVVTHLQSIEGSIYKIKLSASENLQMLERTGNKRGLYVKLADRLHNMRTIKGHGQLEKRKQIVEETMQFFVPLAERLGLQETTQELEKLCLEVFRQKSST